MAIRRQSGRAHALENTGRVGKFPDSMTKQAEATSEGTDHQSHLLSTAVLFAFFTVYCLCNHTSQSVPPSPWCKRDGPATEQTVVISR